jgi:hypothetical protein
MRYFISSRFWRLTHKFNWHYMPVLGPFEDGHKVARCEWCGLRDHIYDSKQAWQVLKNAS